MTTKPYKHEMHMLPGTGSSLAKMKSSAARTRGREGTKIQPSDTADAREHGRITNSEVETCEILLATVK
jgi:hypothetical protein